MEIKSIKKDKEKQVFILKGINAVTINTIRRLVTNQVPTLAIEEVNFLKNSSALYDEMIAHRLGLIPLKTDLKSYTLPEDCKCKGEGCALCQLNINLSVKGPAIVYASELKTKDPKVKPIHPKMPIVKLLKDQELELEAVAVLGYGKQHIKFTPGFVYYRGYPILTATKSASVKKCLAECPNITQKGSKLEVKDILKWNEADEGICEKNGINIESSKDEFIFSVESWGQLTPKEMILTALDILDKKLDEFEKELKKLK